MSRPAGDWEAMPGCPLYQGVSGVVVDVKVLTSWPSWGLPLHPDLLVALTWCWLTRESEDRKTKMFISSTRTGLQLGDRCSGRTLAQRLLIHESSDGCI